MKTGALLFLWMGLGAWAREAPPLPSAPLEVRWPAPQVHALSDGTPVWLVPRPATPLVRVEVTLRSGYLDLERPEAGLLAGAVAAEAAQEAARSLAAVGGRLSVGAGAERVWADVEVLRGGEAAGLEALREALLAPRLERRAVARTRQAWARERSTTWRRVGGVHALALNQLLFGEDHPLGLRPSVRDWRSLSAREVRAAWAQLLRRGAAAIVVTGDAEAAQILPLLEQHLRGLGGTQTPQPVPPPLWPSEGWAVVVVDQPGAGQVRITHTRAAPGLGEPARPAAEVVAHALGGDFASRLSRQVREEDGLVYEISGVLWARPGMGRLEVSCVTAPEEAGRTVATIAAVMAGMVSQPPDGAEVRAVQQALALERARHLEHLETLARPYGLALLHGETDPSAWPEALDAVTAAEAAEAARSLLAAPQGVWLLTGDAEILEPALEAEGWTIDRRLDGRGVAQGDGAQERGWSRDAAVR